MSILRGHSELPQHLEIVADYGEHDLAFAEVVRRFDGLIEAAVPVSLVTTASFDSGANGHYVARRAKSWDRGPGVLFHNVAPRRDNHSARAANEGEELFAAQLDNGLLIVGPNSAGSWAPLAADGGTIRRVPFAHTGSQFRSRENFPQVVVELWRRGNLEDYPIASQSDVGGSIAPIAEVTQLLGPGASKDSSGRRVILITDHQDTLPDTGADTGDVVRVRVNPADYTSAGFCAAQLALNGSSPGSIFLGWKTPSHATALDNGVAVFGPADSGAWEFLHEAGANIRRLASPRTPREYLHLGIPEFGAGDVPVAFDPPPEDVPVYVDRYGNVKTTAKVSQPPGTPVTVSVGGPSVEAVTAGGSFAVRVGVTAVAPGSSGWQLPGTSRARIFPRSSNGEAALRARSG